MKQKETTSLPKHVAIILDGNRRWARERNLPYIKGHAEALKRVEEIVEYSANADIKFLTLWAWSPKNFKRNKKFVDNIMNLFRKHLTVKGSFGRAIEKGAKIHHIGTLDGFPKDIKKSFSQLLKKNPVEKKIDLILALGYEGRSEILRAVRKIVKRGARRDDITEKFFSKHLDTAKFPDPDFVIRTGGDKRLSGFLLWQIADAELYFPKTYLPDFTVDKYKKALEEYAKRERRFGGDSKIY